LQLLQPARQPPQRSSSSDNITQIEVDPEFGSGDAVSILSTQVAGCEGGYWILLSQLGFKQTFAFILQARATGQSITAAGSNALIWNGSSTKYGKLGWVTVP